MYTKNSLIGFDAKYTVVTTIMLSLAFAVLGSARGTAAEEDSRTLQKVRVSVDGQGFELGESGAAFVPWGFNYLGEYEKLVEETWDEDWPRLERDFREMRKLGANVVRVHLQFGTYMKGPKQFDTAQLDRLKKMLDLASDVGLYLDVTGLSCYRLAQVPQWYDALEEAERWEAQALWWGKIAEMCAGHPAVFCYDLMNEPVIGGAAKEGEPRWLSGELGGFHFIQGLTDNPRGRSSTDIAKAWAEKLTTAIRRQDPATPITVGVIPWAQIWPTAKPLFYSPEVADHFDFVSIHSYPGRDKVDQAIASLAVYDIGKPLVVEETFPLSCTLAELDQFIEGGKGRVDGWISHYFGHTIEEHAAGAEPVGTGAEAPFELTVADFLAYWRDKGKTIAGTTPEPAGEDAAPALSSTNRHPSPVAGLEIRGSVEQIYISGAKANAQVTINGPADFLSTQTTDDQGGLVVRSVPPGDGYQVTVEESPAAASVNVLRRDQHPEQAFYDAQQLPPTSGYIETRDGTLLSYRVVLPDAEVHGPGPYGLVITYSGYQPSIESVDGHQDAPFAKFSAAGYAVAGVNMRGSACSGGSFDLMEPITWLDGYDMVEAFAAQDWVDGVALGDQSWPGLTQLYVASTQPPSLDAVLAGSVVGDLYRDVFYPGGIPNIGFGHIWPSARDAENTYPSRRKEVNARVETDPICAANQALRGQNVSLLETVEARPYDDEFWRVRSAEPLVSKIVAPTLQVVSWQDAQVGSRPATLYERFDKATPVRLVGVNGFHQYWYGTTYDQVLEFLNIYLGKSSSEEIARYEARNDFLVLLESDSKGNARGRFSLPGFGAAGDGVRMALGPDLAPLQDDGTSDSSTFTYDPSSPGSWTAPTQDQVAFTSEAVTANTVMAGSGSADLWIAAEADDVDLQVTLSEVRPDGREMLVQSGWLRASHRALDEAASTVLRPMHLHTAESKEKLTPGQMTAVRIELFPFAHVFRAGSRIRLRVSGPGGAVNGWPWAFEAVPGGFPVHVAHHTKEHPSSVVLPIVHPTDLDLPDAPPDADSVWLQPSRLERSR